MYPREYFDTYWRGDIKNEIFVAMPFSDEFKLVWEQAIKPAIEHDTKGSPIANRVDSTTLAGSIIIDILDGIANSKLVFAEISINKDGKCKGQRNSNVMYEIGIAHAIRQSTEILMVRDDNEKINFDIAGIRIQMYNRNDLSDARQKFGLLINNCLDSIDREKSLIVQKIITLIDKDCFNIMQHEGKNKKVRIASEYYEDVLSMSLVTKTKDYDDAFKKLLDLNLINGLFLKDLGVYEYYWTNLGKIVLKHLGLR